MAKVPEPDEAIALAQSLKDARARVVELEQRWQAFFTIPEEVETNGSAETGRVSLQGKILALLDENPRVTFTAARVTATLNANPNSVGPLLSRLVSERKIEKVGHGEYRSLSNGENNNDQQYEWPSLEGRP